MSIDIFSQRSELRHEIQLINPEGAMEVSQSDKKANHRVDIVRLGAPRVHTNADSLELFDIGGYQVVTKKGQFKENDLAIYIQPDSVIPQTEVFKFIWEPYVNDVVTGMLGQNGMSLIPERRRRITVRKFRKEWSEGLLMPVADFGYVNPDGVAVINRIGVVEGGDVSDLIGITHWTGDDVESTQSDNDRRPSRSYPKTAKGWLYFILYKLGLRGFKKSLAEELAFDIPGFDVDNIKNFKNAIRPDDFVIVTEKIHGSQFKAFFKEGRMYVGSRNFWKAPTSQCVWRKALVQNPWIEEYCRENEGAVIYGEVVPTQKNGFRYGCQEGEIKVFVFDVRDGVTGEYLPKKTVLVDKRLSPVPIVYCGPYCEMPADIENRSSGIPGQTQREGVVITVADPTRWERGLGRIQLKRISNAFLKKDAE